MHKHLLYNIHIIIIEIILLILSYQIFEIKSKLNQPQKPVSIVLKNKPIKTKLDFKSKSPREGLKEALTYYDIKHPKIVYAQAVLETGNFTSNLYKTHNNLFGLYNSSTKQYYKFNHWTHSIVAYKKYIQYRYTKHDSNPSHYYSFLKNIGYAEDPSYITKLKQLKQR